MCATVEVILLCIAVFVRPLLEHRMHIVKCRAV